MKVALTGASGHVGAVLCGQLLSKGWSVKALTRSGELPFDSTGLTLVKGDVFDQNALNDLVRDCTYVFHLAAKISIDGDPDGSVYDTNVNGVKNVVRACLDHGIKRLVHCSSVRAIKSNDRNEELIEKNPSSGKSDLAYDYSKACGEAEVLKGVEQGLEAVILNPTSIIGPPDYRPSLVGQSVLDLLNRKITALTKGGFDWVDVRDVCEALISATEKGQNGERYILGGEYRTMVDFAKLVCRTGGVKPPGMTLPTWMVYAALPLEKMRSRLSGKQAVFTSDSLEMLLNGSIRISHEKAKNELDFHPRPLEETVRDLIDWLRQNGMWHDNR